MATPEGWYPDPTNSEQIRRWSGTEWTQDVQPHPGLTAPSPAPAPVAAPAPEPMPVPMPVPVVALPALTQLPTVALAPTPAPAPEPAPAPAPAPAVAATGLPALPGFGASASAPPTSGTRDALGAFVPLEGAPTARPALIAPGAPTPTPAPAWGTPATAATPGAAAGYSPAPDPGAGHAAGPGGVSFPQPAAGVSTPPTSVPMQRYTNDAPAPRPFSATPRAAWAGVLLGMQSALPLMYGIASIFAASLIDDFSSGGYGSFGDASMDSAGSMLTVIGFLGLGYGLLLLVGGAGTAMSKSWGRAMGLAGEAIAVIAALFFFVRSESIAGAALMLSVPLLVAFLILTDR